MLARNYDEELFDPKRASSPSVRYLIYQLEICFLSELVDSNELEGEKRSSDAAHIFEAIILDIDGVFI